MIGPIGFNNRRRFPRFKLEGDLFVLHRDMGIVQEIGIGGVLFTYVEKLHLQDNYPEEGVLFTETDFVVELPFKTVSDAFLDYLPLGQGNTRQRIILFDDLRADHLDQLEELILANVNIPTMDDSVTMDEVACWN